MHALAMPAAVVAAHDLASNARVAVSALAPGSVAIAHAMSGAAVGAADALRAVGSRPSMGADAALASLAITAA